MSQFSSFVLALTEQERSVCDSPPTLPISCWGSRSQKLSFILVYCGWWALPWWLKFISCRVSCLGSRRAMPCWSWTSEPGLCRFLQAPGWLFFGGVSDKSSFRPQFPDLGDGPRNILRPGHFLVVNILFQDRLPSWYSALGQ